MYLIVAPACLRQRIIYINWTIHLGHSEADMLLTAKLNLMSGMVIGAAALMVMKQVCKRKRCKKQEETHAPIATSN